MSNLVSWRTRAVKAVRLWLKAEGLTDSVQRSIQDDPAWLLDQQFYLGMRVRNLLREKDLDLSQTLLDTEWMDVVRLALKDNS